jgi:hypothetical protein
MNKMQFLALTLSLGAVVVLSPTSAYAQKAGQDMPRITIDLKDAGIRGALEAMFKQAGINNYVIDNNVAGFVTLKITEQPFENAFKLIMRASSIPLTYTKENDVWIVKPRTITQNPQDLGGTPPEDPTGVRPPAAFERINLTYLDPMDLQNILGGVQTISFFSRFGNMGGMGGGMGGMGGGMGGMGGGMMGGMGGGMGGFGGFGR